MIQAGMLTERVTLAKRTEANPDSPNDYGNPVSVWADQGTVWAQYTHLRGSESVMAARLQGQHSVVIRVRASTLARQVTPEWRVTDARTGVEYAVRDVTPDPSRAFVDLLCMSGVAA